MIDGHWLPVSLADRRGIHLTDDERRLCRALSRCTYLPGSPDKRFARTLGAVADDPEGGLTERQREYLHRMARRYRRQLGTEWERWCVALYGVQG